MTPLMSAETGEGAAGCASGSHTCSGRIPAFAPKPKSARRKPAEAQKVITEVAFETKEKQAALWNQMDIEGRDALVAAGGQMVMIPDAEAAKWVKKVEPVLDEYKKAMVGKGQKEADIDSWIKFARERTSYWRGEEKKRGVAAPF